MLNCNKIAKKEAGDPESGHPLQLDIGILSVGKHREHVLGEQTGYGNEVIVDATCYADDYNTGNTYDHAYTFAACRAE